MVSGVARRRGRAGPLDWIANHRSLQFKEHGQTAHWVSAVIAEEGGRNAGGPERDDARQSQKP